MNSDPWQDPKPITPKSGLYHSYSVDYRTLRWIYSLDIHISICTWILFLGFFIRTLRWIYFLDPLKVFFASGHRPQARERWSFLSRMQPGKCTPRPGVWVAGEACSLNLVIFVPQHMIGIIRLFCIHLHLSSIWGFFVLSAEALSVGLCIATWSARDKVL